MTSSRNFCKITSLPQKARDERVACTLQSTALFATRHDSVRPRETPGAAIRYRHCCEKRGSRKNHRDLARSCAPALTFFMYHRELSTLMVQSLFTDGRRQKHLARTNRANAHSSTDFLRREFRNTREAEGVSSVRVFLRVTRSG